MRATTPILMCDDESGCDETTPDFYEMLAQNWRELMDKGWTYDPYRDPDAALCPKHAPETPPPAGVPTAYPRVLDTVEAMDALPAGSIVRYCNLALATVSSSRTSEGWMISGVQRPHSSGQLLDEAAELEVVVVFVPEVS